MGFRGAFLVLVLVIFAGSATPAEAQLGRRGSVTLTWTAPGDDSLSGQALKYDVRAAARPITEQTFTTSNQIAVLVPAAPGTQEKFTVPGLLPGLDYFFAIRSMDEAGNWSGISNVAYRSGRSIGIESAAANFLSPPWPNPAVHHAYATLRVPAGRTGRVEVFDALGRRVRTLLVGTASEDGTPMSWDLRNDDGTPVHAGLFTVRARFGDWVEHRHLTVVR